MEKNFYLMVNIQSLRADRTAIVGTINSTPSSQKELENIRDAMYPTILDLRYLVLMKPETSTEIWVPGSFIENSIVSFQVVRSDTIHQKR